MSSIATMTKTNDMLSAALAAEAEFKRAMEDVDVSFTNLLAPANVAIPNTSDTEVNYRPAVQ